MRIASAVLFAGAASLGFGCVHAPVTGELGRAPYLRAHLDRLQPAKLKQFEDGRREWLAALAVQKGFDPWWGSFFELEGLGFLSLRPLGSLGELGRKAPDTPVTPERTAAVTRYNQQSDEGLLFPHRSQIWRVESDLTYQPPGGAVALTGPGRGKVVFEGVEPTQSDDYEKAWKEIHLALAKARFPLAHFVFSNLYGDGRVVSVWLGPAEAHAPELEAALRLALGAERAGELLRAARAPVATTEEYPLRARPDLSDRPD